MAYSEEDLKKIEAYERIHLKENQRELPPGEKVQALQGRDRNKWLQVGLNILAIVFFGYSYYFHITRLGDTLLIILFVVFLLNMVMIFYQKRQIEKLIEYYESQQE